MTSWEVEFPERLDKFLAQRLPEHSRSRLAKWIEQGEVLVNGEPRSAGFKLKPGMRVSTEPVPETPAHDLSPSHERIEVLYEDDEVLVVAKPRGMATHPAPGLKESTLVNALLGRGGTLSEGSAEYRPGIVHRLDKETTGLLIIAKSDAAHRHLAAQIAAKTCERRYFAVCVGEFPEARLRIEAPIARNKHDRRKMAVSPDGKPAVTHVKRAHSAGDLSWLAIRLETGRTHQIRVHLTAAGYPILGDAIYSKSKSHELSLQLHAAYLEFTHPSSGERMAFFAPPPSDFEGYQDAFESMIRIW